MAGYALAERLQFLQLKKTIGATKTRDSKKEEQSSGTDATRARRFRFSVGWPAITYEK